jgi:hypothetical protein
LAELRELRAALDSGAAMHERTPEPSYDTRAIERAFGVGGAATGPTSGLPNLSDAEMREIANEVGLELHERTSDVQPARAPVSRSAPEHSHFGLPSTIAAERMLPALPNLETQRRIVRELERNLGGTGIVEQFESGMAWANRDAEAAIDRCPGGARLTVRRSFAKLARKRRRRGLIFGGIFGTMIGGILTDVLLPFMMPLEPLVVFSGTAAGLVLGSKIARKLHKRQMAEERALLAWVSERVHALVEADSDSSRMLGEAKR